MSEVLPPRPCLFCESGLASTSYGLCKACCQLPALRRMYMRSRGRTPEWEAHLLYLTERASRRLPLFEEGYESPPHPFQLLGEDRPRPRWPIVRHVHLPPAGRREED
jgi:hypothetical protein